MKRYSSTAPCVKCGSRLMPTVKWEKHREAVWVPQYRDAGSLPKPSVITSERMVVTCKTCGYVDYLQPLDAPSSAAPESPDGRYQS